MHFDHVRDKAESLSFMRTHNRTVAAILSEVAKCEVVCILCHRHRTYTRGKYPIMSTEQEGMVTKWYHR